MFQSQSHDFIATKIWNNISRNSSFQRSWRVHLDITVCFTGRPSRPCLSLWVFVSCRLTLDMYFSVFFSFPFEPGTWPGSQINTCLFQLADLSVHGVMCTHVWFVWRCLFKKIVCICVQERRRHMEGGSLCNLQLSRTTGSQGFIILQATVPTQSTACS